MENSRECGVVDRPHLFLFRHTDFATTSSLALLTGVWPGACPRFFDCDVFLDAEGCLILVDFLTLFVGVAADTFFGIRKFRTAVDFGKQSTVGVATFDDNIGTAPDGTGWRLLSMLAGSELKLQR